MSITEIKQALDTGKKVYWSNESYQVIKSQGTYLIAHQNGSCIGLTWQDEVTLNGNEEDFFTN